MQDHKVGFNDLSFCLKLAIIWSFLQLGFFIIGLCVGLFFA